MPIFLTDLKSTIYSPKKKDRKRSTLLLVDITVMSYSNSVKDRHTGHTSDLRPAGNS